MLPRQLKPGTAYLCMRPGDHGVVSTSSMFSSRRPGRASGRLAAVPDTLPRELERACAGADGYSRLGSCRAVTRAMVLCSPACPPWPSAVLASTQSLSTPPRCCGTAIAKLLVVWRAWSSAEPAAACSTMLPAMRLCKHLHGEPGLTLCHCAWVASAWGEPIRPCFSP